MTYKVEYESLVSNELHVSVSDITQLPIVIEDKMITELHNVNDGLFEPEKAPKVTPAEAQVSDWFWETNNGKIGIIGEINPINGPCNLEFWLK